MGLIKVYNQILEATGLNRVFPRGEEPQFTAHNERFGTANYVYKPIVDELSRLIGLGHDPMVPGGRLTLESGVPVSTSDQTAKTTVYYTPFIGQMITLWNTTQKTWYAYPFSEISLALGTVTSGLPYDVFATLTSGSITGASSATPIIISSTAHGLSNGDLILINGVKGNTAANGFRKVASVTANTFAIQDLDGNSIAYNNTYVSDGTWYKVTLDKTAWTNGTTRATALTRQNGIWCKNGALNYRYLGTFYTSSTTTTEDSRQHRRLFNYYNRVNRAIGFQPSDDDYDYTTAAYTEYDNGGAGCRVSIMNGVAEEGIDLKANMTVFNTTTAVQATVSIGYDSTTVRTGTTGSIICSNAFAQGISSGLGHTPTLGYHFYALIIYSTAAGGTTRWYGDGGASTVFQSGLEGIWRC